MKQVVVLDKADLVRLQQGETLPLSEDLSLAYAVPLGQLKKKVCAKCARPLPGPHTRKCPLKGKAA